MPSVTSLPPSKSNKAFCYARAEFRNAAGERRVLVWQVNRASQGRSGSVSLRENLGADNLPGTLQPMSGSELMGFLVGLEASGRARVGGEEIAFPDELLTEFLARARARMADARGQS